MPISPSLGARLPTDVYIEPTNRCNSRCRVCIRSFNTMEPSRDLSFPEFARIVEQFPDARRIVLHGIGEPLLNAYLPRMIRHAHDVCPSASVLFNSNAIALTAEWQQALVDAGLDEYRISIDAASRETYARIRGVDAFDTVVENTRRFVASIGDGETPRISLWFVAMKENVHELPALVDVAAELRVREVYVQRLVQFAAGLASVEQSLYRRLQQSEAEALRHAQERADALGITMRASGLTSPGESLKGCATTERPWYRCNRPWTTTYITANGNVLPCCISPFSTHDYPGLILGNVFETPFAEIWEGAAYAERRERIRSDHPVHPCELCGVHWSL